MTATKFIDSNIFFYAKIMDRKYGAACARILRWIDSGDIAAATSALAIIEVANALRKYGLSDEVKNVIDAMLSLEISILQVDSTDVRRGVDIFNISRISPYDCIHAAVMNKAGIKEIISADKEFDKVAAITRLDPLQLSTANG